MTWFISINSLTMLMNRQSKPTRRRFLLNTGMLAAGLELSCADAILAQELTPTPSCHDADEPTVRQTEGPFFKPGKEQGILQKQSLDAIFARDYTSDSNRLQPKFPTQQNREFGSQ
jgi:hypothetical protein